MTGTVEILISPSSLSFIVVQLIWGQIDNFSKQDIGKKRNRVIRTKQTKKEAVLAGCPFPCQHGCTTSPKVRN